jgi:sugar/nucleoside kinase (ribokinase family)
MLATPEEIEKQIPELIKLRAQYGITERPFVVWEPFPASCTRQNRHAYLQACRHVDVFSPNHLEISALFEDTSPKGFQPDQLEAYALEFCKGTGVSGNGIVVVRCGEYGSLTTRNAATAKQVWVPSYYEAGAAEVVDATGGGNTYLGGFLQGW